MTGRARFRWGRVIGAIILAEALPILLLVAVVFVYGFLRKEGSPSPAEFAPRAGNWVGPIGGFVATLLFAWWAARRAPRESSRTARPSASERLSSTSAWQSYLPDPTRFIRFCSSRTRVEFSRVSSADGARPPLARLNRVQQRPHLKSDG
jgi:hypothetical protein